ncbi:hypothetical protein [Staphylococcus felis]|uniref:hypothetical protein n=1 Tax=Staphylococcus felis TaxID=46127 RepID=UPI003966BF15
MDIKEYKYKLCIPCSILNHYELCRNDDSYIYCSREEELLALASSLSLNIKNRPLVMMQNSGFVNTINTFTSLVKAYDFKFDIIISVRGEINEHNKVQKVLGESFKKIIYALEKNIFIANSKDDLNSIMRDLDNNELNIILLYKG